MKYPKILLICSLILSCNEEDDPYERIQKLRTLGVTTDPIGVAPTGLPGQKFTLTVYAALPLGQSVTLEPTLDNLSKYAQAVPVSPIAGSDNYKEFAQLRLFQTQLTLDVPPIKPEDIPKGTGFLPLRYAFVLRSGSEEEKIVGNVILYEPQSPKLNWKAPEAEIISPKSGDKVENKAKIELKANLLSKNPEENTRISWFVSSGDVINRRAQETFWQKADEGTQTVILTVRGLKSGAMSPPLVFDVSL